MTFDKEELSKHKIKYSVILIILILIVFNISKNIFNYLKTSEFVSCFGKDVCIYRGPKSQYPYSNSPHYINLKNGDIFIYHDIFIGCPTCYKYEEFCAKFDAFNPLSRSHNFCIGNLSKIEKFFQFSTRRKAEIYKNKKNKFCKIKTKKTAFDNQKGKQGFIEALIENAEGNVIIVDSGRLLSIYDTKTKQIEETNIDYFVRYDQNYEEKILKDRYKSKYQYLTNFGDKILMIEPDTKDLYTLDINTFDVEYFTQWYKKPDSIPNSDDIIVLSNNKIIIPIMKKGFSYYKGRGGLAIGDSKSTYDKYELDHIEIYDPKDNIFIANYDTYILKDNIFCIKKDNGDLIFIHKDKSYIFNNKSNKFYLADNKELQKNINDMNTLSFYANKYFLANLNKQTKDKFKIINLSDNKFLITCSDKFYNDVWVSNPNLYNQTCKQTLYYDYNDSVVKEGPKFIDLYPNSSFIHLNKNKTMILSGHEYVKFKEFARHDYTQLDERKSNRIQVIKYKK